jgi:hypothetical protein
MTKTEVSKLVITATEHIALVHQAVKELTAENPLILFDKEQEDLSDIVYDFPYAYYVEKYGYHISGVVYKVCGDEVEMFLTGEEYGDMHQLKLYEIPHTSLIDILDILKDRM